MTSTLPLIINEEPVTRGLLARMKQSKPSIAVVYSDGFGRIAYLGGRPLSWSEQLASKYRTRYEVDISDHRRAARLESSPLPSRGDMYFFHCMVDVGFRVTDPAAVVERHVTDALVVVYNHIIDVSRPVTRRYDIKDAQGAEAEINSLFYGPVQLPEGITIYRCATRLLPDAAAQDYLRSLESAGRTLIAGSAEHQVTMAAARHEHEIAALAQQARLEAERLELSAMDGQRMDLAGLIRMHLVKHPDETAYATELLMRHQQALAAQQGVDDQRTMDLARYMMEQGLIQSVDVEILRDKALGRIQDIAGSGRPAALSSAASWDEALPPGAGPALHLGPEPAPIAAQTGGPPGHDLTGRVIPVYVVIDESATDPGYFTALNNSLQGLPADLAAHEEIITAVRLAVLGYARDVAVRMPLNVVAPGSFVPTLSYHEGAGLAVIFDYLHARIPQDIDRLKSQDLTPGRPTVYLLAAADPGPGWEAAHRRLTDRSAFPYAPNIIACGIGAAQPGAISRIATQAESGWVAAPALSAGDATSSCMAFVRNSIISLCQAHVSGSGDTTIARPNGFRPAGSQ